MPTRTRQIAGNGGSYNYRGALSAISGMEEAVTQVDIVDDTSSWNKPMTITHRRSDGLGMSRTQWLNTAQTQWKITEGFIPSYFRSPRVLTHLTDPARPSNSDLSVMLAARLNPNYASVDLPVSFLELRELPQLLRSLGQSSIKRFSKGNLSYEFGVKPMLSDLAKLIQFGKSFENRLADLQRLRDSGGYTRKVGLWSGSVISAPDTLVTTNSSPSTFQCSHRLTMITTSRKAWGYGNILADKSWVRSPPSDQQLKYFTRRAVLGASPSLSTAWELIPWSWLIDWFSTIGDFLAANRGGIPFRLSEPAVCVYGLTTYHYVLESSNFGFLKGEHSWTLSEETKSRIAYTGAFPSLTLPAITRRQVGILGSLAVLRMR